MTMPRDEAPTLSVVVPIYGVEKWLPEFLDSLLWQTFEDWEAILVIDGSPDGCVQIAEDYASRDARLQVHSFTNGGLGRARNRGFALATGRYVTFPDSDDVIAPHAFELLVGSLVETGSDIVAAVAEDFYPDGRREVYWAQRSDLFAIRHSAVSLREEPRLVTDHVAWNKVFRTAMLRDNSIEYPTDTLCEDVVHSLKAYSVAHAVDVIPEVVYFHRRRDDAITANIMGAQIVSDWLEQTEQACDLVIEFGDPDVLQVFVRRLLSDEIWTRLSRFNQIEDADGLGSLVNLISRALAIATPETLESLPPMKSFALQHAVHGGLWRSWQSKGFWLSPYSDQVESLAYTAGAVGQAVVLLDPADPLESLLATAMVRERILRGLAQFTPLPPDVFPSIIRELRAIWPDDATVEQLSLRDGFERSVRDAVARNDSGMLERAVERERAFGSGRLLGITPAGSRFALEGTLASTVPLTPEITFELVLRSRSSRKVRTRRVRAWQTDTEDDLRWHATIPTDPEWCDEDWALWLRVFETGFDSRTLRISRGEGELIVQQVDGASHSLRIAPDRDLALSLAAADAPTDIAPASASTPSGDHIRTIVAFPLWADNPYLNLLYLETRARGVDVKPVTRLPALLEQLAGCGEGSALHLHWTSPICELANSAEEAEAQTSTFITAVTEALGRGMCLIWTVHNVLPHDARFVEAAITLHAFLARHADRIHILSPATVAQAAPHYAIPESKVELISHSSYEGIYGPALDRADARARLGIDEDELAVLAFGQLRPYKGLLELFAAAQRAGLRRPGIVLLVAGSTSAEDLAVLDENVPTSVRLVRHHSYIADGDVSGWFSAADLAVFPYRNILNSGSVHLAATFGVPSILPGEPHLRSQFAGSSWIDYFDPAAAVESLAEVLVDWNDDSHAKRVSARTAAEAYTPHEMSSDFATFVTGLRPSLVVQDR